jgi:putative transcriptional regulator
MPENLPPQSLPNSLAAAKNLVVPRHGERHSAESATSMLNITFEFVGGPNDGRVEQGKLGEPSDAERHYLFSHHGRVGQQFAVAADYTVEALAGEDKQAGHAVQRHHYVVTDRSEDSEEVWVRAEYLPQPEPQPQAAASTPDLDGRLLIASPYLQSNMFARTVVLVIHNDEEEALGVILNRPTPETVGELWSEVSEVPCASEQPVHVGGPSDGPVIALHTGEPSGDVSVAPGVFLAIDKEELDRLVQHDDDASFRLFLGAARWDSGQLAQELRQGIWLTVPATKELIFGDADHLWQNSLRRFGRNFLRSIGVRRIPDNPQVN